MEDEEKLKSPKEKGKQIGESTREFFDGLTENPDKTYGARLFVSDALQEKGFTSNKFFSEMNMLGKKNQLGLYVVFQEDFYGDLTAILQDKFQNEYRRKTLDVEGEAGRAR